MTTAPRLGTLPLSPFRRLDRLLDGIAPGRPPILLSVGDPKGVPPPFVMEAIARAARDFGSYPQALGLAPLRESIASFLSRRFHLPQGMIDSERHVLPVVGTREGLALALLCVLPDQPKERPAVLIPNPFYQCYAAAALSGGAEPIYVDAKPAQGFLPEFAQVPEEILRRTAALFICSPSNPEGAVADIAYWQKLFALSDRYGITIIADECYSEVFDEDQAEAPIGALEAANRSGRDLSRLIVFNSLSKRSSLPGMRSGLVAGHADFIAAYRDMRNYVGATMPAPLQMASAAAWADEAHVRAMRQAHVARINAAEKIFSNRHGFRRPPGGFFLWLDVGDGEGATRKLWREAGVKVLPGAYLAQTNAAGDNPAAAYIRIALVNELETTRAALERVGEVLG